MNRHTWLAALTLGVAVSGLGATGCAKNETATRACGAASDGSSCSACCKANGATGYKFTSGNCSCLGGEGAAVGIAKAGPTTKSEPATTTSFAGTYKSNWGPTVFAQNGAAIVATYPNGSMACQPSGNTLDCDWKEAKSAGKAKLTKQPDGSLKGTWGTGTSATNGGPWLFTP